MLSMLSAFVFVSFLGLVYGGSNVPSDGPLLHVILLLEDISQSGSITSQLVDVFTSRGNTVSLIDEIGESQLDGLAACGAVLGKSTSDHANPAQLPGQVNGLVDAEGIPVGVAGTVLASAHEPGLANGE